VQLLRTVICISVLLVFALAPACGGCGRTVSADAGTGLPGSAATGDDRAQAVQALLDSPWIQNALQPEGGRPPTSLVVVAPPGLEGAPLHAFGQPVRVLSPAEVQAQRPESYLELTRFTLEGDRAGLSFRAEAEGVSGEALLERAQGRWKVAKVTGTEH
jgi:hypothetical protein